VVVVVVGIDQTRRGKAKWETDAATGQRNWVDRWDTGLVAKEPLHELLSCAQRGGLRYEIRAALERFYRFCAA
jgi:hypothetical protein